MQPIQRPPYDPRGMGPAPPGMPPQMRSQGFRPPQMQQGIPASGNFNRPPSGPPIQKMAEMNLGPQMPPMQPRSNMAQMNPALRNGVSGTQDADMPQNIPSFGDQNLTSSLQQNTPNASYRQAEFSSNPENNSLTEQTVMAQSGSNPHVHNFSASRAQPPEPMRNEQPAMLEGSMQNIPPVPQTSTNCMPFQSSVTSPLPSTAGISPSVGPIMSTHISGQPMQPQIPHSASPAVSQSPRFTMPTTSAPELPTTPGQSMHSMPQPSVPGMPQQKLGPGLQQSYEPGINQVSAMSRGPNMPPNLVSPSGHDPQMQPIVSEPGMPMQSSLSPFPAGPGMPPQNYGSGRLPQSSRGAGMAPQMTSPGMAPQMTSQGMSPQMTRPGMSPQMPGAGMPPQMTRPGVSPQMPGAGVAPQMTRPGVSPQMPGAGMAPQRPAMSARSIQPPAMQHPARSPLVPPMPPGFDSSTRFGMPPRPMGNMGTPGGMGPAPQAYPPTSGFSPGMAPMPPRMGDATDAVSYPSMPGPPPQSGAMPPPGAGGQQQYAAQQGGMQNRYPGSNAQASPGMGGYPQGQGRKLNPDDMPSPLQVIEEDMQNRSGEFITNLKGTLPPMVTTDFYVTDGGNASPRFMRSTMYSVPGTPDQMKQAAVPFGLVISPMATLHPGEAPLYIGTSLANGPVRCNRCKAYMSTLMTFMDGGRRFQCLLCKQTNEVPPDYYCHMDSQGARADKFQRPELCLGAFEYIATPEYCRDKLLPKEPAFIFVLEMTQMMLQRGIVSLLCKNMKDILRNLPVDRVPGQEQEGLRSKIHVGFITYDSSVHFYKLSGLSPEMCVVCDKEDMFVPVPDGILCAPDQVADNIDKLMESIPQNFQAARETSGNLYAAISAGMAALKAAGRTGKLFVFHSSLPHGDGVGRVKMREDRKVLGTDKEKTVLTPQNSHYGSLAQDLVTTGCAVDLYLFNEAYVDVATLGQVCRLTGGQCFKYTYFTANKDAPRLLADLRINVGRDIAFEAVMRVRTSTGVRSVEFYGHFFMSNTHDVELAAVDSSKAVAVEIKHDDKITEEDGVYLQTALLYTSCGGQRRLRVLNLSLNVCTQMADLFKSFDHDTLMNFFAKEAMFKFLQTSAKLVKENLIARTAQILSCYRKNCASPSSIGQLILPELLKLLPLYINCLSRSDALSGGQDLTCDDRSWHINQLCTMDVAASAAYLYPRLIPLSDIDPQGTTVPSPLRSSYEKLRPDGVFLLENGLFMFIWVGSGISTTWMTDVFGVAAPHHLDPVISELPELDNPTSQRVRGIVDSVRLERGLHLRLFVVPQQGKHELIMKNYLVEDKSMLGAPSYVEFLCHIHKEVRAILS